MPRLHVIAPSSTSFTKGLESNRTATGILVFSDLHGDATQQLSGHAARGKSYIERQTPRFEDHAASIERKVLKTAVEKADQHTINQPLIQEVIMSEDSRNDPVSDNAGSPGNGLPDDGLDMEFQSEPPEFERRSVSTVPDAESIISG